jgi:hypothetical protein
MLQIDGRGGGGINYIISVYFFDYTYVRYLSSATTQDTKLII